MTCHHDLCHAHNADYGTAGCQRHTNPAGGGDPSILPPSSARDCFDPAPGTSSIERASDEGGSS